MLPVNEMASGQHSPYSTLSAMAIDPDLHPHRRRARVRGDRRRGVARRRRPGALAGGGPRGAADRLPGGSRAEARRAARRLRSSSSGIISASSRARAAAFEAFVERERDWLDDYALFRALHDAVRSPRRGGTGPSRWRAREPAALARGASARLAREMRFFEYVQWIADAQWHEARRRAAPVRLFGDLPFMVGADSADVWAGEHAFARDLSVGTPPDAFSDDGQDWGLPAYRWDVVVREDFRWLRARAHRATELFDGYRVDHVIGFYRTWVRPSRAAPAVLHAAPTKPISASSDGASCRSSSTRAPASSPRISARCPTSCASRSPSCGVPGYKVFRWEREWKQSGQPFRDPGELPAAVAGDHRHARHRHAGRVVGRRAARRARGDPAPARARRSAACAPSDAFGPRGARRAARARARLRLEPRGPADAGHLRLARSHQHAGHGRRHQLDVASALAGRHAGEGARGARARACAAQAGSSADRAAPTSTRSTRRRHLHGL